MAKSSKSSSPKSKKSASAGDKPARKPATTASTARPAGAAEGPRNEFEPGSRLTFTVSRVPARPAQQKTIRRLMRLQPEIQRGLKKLSRRRQRDINDPRQRGGRMWIHRARATKLTHVGEGESFTITVTPQIIPDIRSVEKFLTVSKG